MKIKDIVLKMLVEDEKTRGNDPYLIYKVYEYMNWPLNLKDIAKSGHNHFESIRRWRAKWQELNPALKPSIQIDLLRQDKQQRFYEEMRGI